MSFLKLSRASLRGLKPQGLLMRLRTAARGQREESRRGTARLAPEDLSLSHTCRIFTCVPHTVSTATGSGAKMLHWYLREGEKSSKIPFLPAGGLFPSAGVVTSPSSICQEAFQQQGASEPAARHEARGVAGPRPLPPPGNYAPSQRGLSLFRGLNGEELRGCGFQPLTTTCRACLHFSYSFQGHIIT